MPEVIKVDEDRNTTTYRLAGTTDEFAMARREPGTNVWGTYTGAEGTKYSGPWIDRVDAEQSAIRYLRDRRAPVVASTPAVAQKPDYATNRTDDTTMYITDGGKRYGFAYKSGGLWKVIINGLTQPVKYATRTQAEDVARKAVTPKAPDVRYWYEYTSGDFHGVSMRFRHKTNRDNAAREHVKLGYRVVLMEDMVADTDE